MTTLLRWASWVFVAAAGTLLILVRIPNPPLSESSQDILMGVSVVTLPAALAHVVRHTDKRSQRNWAILLGLVVVLVVITFLVTP